MEHFQLNFQLNTTAEKAKMVKKMGDAVSWLVNRCVYLADDQPRDDAPVLVRRRQQNLVGCAWFPHGVNEHAVVIGEHRRAIVPGTPYVHDCGNRLIRHGEDTLIHGGQIILVFRSTKEGPVDTKMRLHRMVVRSGIDFKPLVRLLEELREDPNRYANQAA